MYTPARPHRARRRRSLRLQGYDDAQAGAYFVTIVSHQRAPLFGDVVDAAVRLNALECVRNCIAERPLRRALEREHPAALRSRGRPPRA